MDQSNRTISNSLDYKNTFLYFFKISKNVQHCFFSPFFCKVMLQHVFNNHNNINMNDIQNSNNYSRIITLPGSALATLPYVWPCIKRGCAPSAGCLCTCIYRMHSKRPANVRRCSRLGKQRVRAPLSCTLGTFHGGVRGGVAKALPVNLVVCNSIKKSWKDFEEGGAGWGLDV